MVQSFWFFFPLFQAVAKRQYAKNKADHFLDSFWLHSCTIEGTGNSASKLNRLLYAKYILHFNCNMNVLCKLAGTLVLFLQC